MSVEQNMVKSISEYWQVLVSAIALIVGYVRMGGKVDTNKAQVDGITISQAKIDDKVNEHDTRIAVIESNIDGIRQASKAHADSVAKIFDLLREK